MKLYEKLTPPVQKDQHPMHMLLLPPTSSLAKEKGHVSWSYFDGK
jgi:hypothetical protein